ncbi:MAG: hypothetical protein K2N07_10890 [Desulfovibrio sp.]|nr:hypothetical protein [Desulfovibrio sp.]
MPALTFSKWSSGGNTTLFLHDAGASPQEQAAWARAVLDPEVLGAEQAGSVTLAGRSLRMAGGEFCVNASRAFGALLALCAAPNGGQWRGEIRVSGWEGPVALTVSGAEPRWDVSARLELPATTRPESHAGGIVVHLPGISHLLLPLEYDAAPPDLLSRARSTLSAAGLLGEAAAGVIWWQPTPEGARMVPVVHVRDAGTLMTEQACGSGALALALALAENGGLEQCRLHQPSGSVLEVRLGQTTTDGRITAEISGPVTLLARGRVWLDASHGAY